MSLTSYVKKRLTDLLEEKRVVVWYDGEEAFGEVARSFAAPDCSVIFAKTSRLSARRRADEVLSCLGDSGQPSPAKNGTLLIYCAWSRGRTQEERLQDPFEGFALIGDGFGDQEAETFQALARLAIPDRANEIDRLFAEGRPTVAILEGLGESVRYPLLQEALGTDSMVEVVARLLFRDDALSKLMGVTGSIQELLRLLQAGLGFTPPPRVTGPASIVDHLGRYVVFSEFALALPGALPDRLTGVPRSPEAYRTAIYCLCDRMRGSDDTRDGYIALGERVEKALRLPEIAGELPELGPRETFPFEERASLKRVQSFARAGNLTAAEQLIKHEPKSVWRNIPERALLWKVATRCVDFLTAVETWSANVFRTGETLRELIQAYTARDGHWQTDRQQRLVEQGAAACAEDDEVASLVALCRERYTEVVGASQSLFIRAVEREGWPPEGISRQSQVFDKQVAAPLEERKKTVYFLVDSMRYEMGRDLGLILDPFGPVTVSSAVTVLPTTTPCGMAALMPGADGAFTLVEAGNELVPAIAGRPLRHSEDRMGLIREKYGDRFYELPLGEFLAMPQRKLQAKVGKADLVVVRTQEIDALGEGPSLYLARKLMSDILGDLRTATDRLIGMGFDTFVYAADHGHVLLPEVAPGSVIQPPPGDWKMKKRRCLLGSSVARAPGVTILRTSQIGIIAPVKDYAVPSGLTAFEAGHGYFHEGLSMQECLIPVVVLQARDRNRPGLGGQEVEIRYRSDRFTSSIIGVRIWFNALLPESFGVRVEAYDGSGAKAKLIGDAADCDARDPATGLVTLIKGSEVQVPVRIKDDFAGPSLELRASDPTTGAILHRLKLQNAKME